MRPSDWTAILAGLALVSCDGPAPAPQAPPAPPPAPMPAPRAEPRWTLQGAPTGDTALVHSDANGQEMLRLACRSGPPSLHATVPGINRVASEDRLTLGAGSELAVFAVSMEGPDRGLIATGQPQPAFVAALAQGREVGVSYGPRQLTLPPPTAQIGAAFAARCADLTVPPDR